MEKLAIFDVDYTITKKETLMEFFKFCIKEDIKNIRFLPRAAFCGIMFLLGVYDEKRTKETYLKFIDGIDEKDLEVLTQKYYKTRLSKIFYDDAIDKIKELKGKGYMVILISASPEFYLKQMYDIKEVDKIIGTRFAFQDGKFTRQIIGKNCKGKEKVERLRKELHKENIEVSYKDSYMFSDSMSDKPLFDIVGNPYLINYKKKNKRIDVLNWK